MSVLRILKPAVAVVVAVSLSVGPVVPLAAQLDSADSAGRPAETYPVGKPAPDRLITLNGARREGELLEITSDGVVRFRGSGAVDGVIESLSLAGLRAIDFGRVDPTGLPVAPDTLWLRSGLALAATLDSGEGDRGRFSVPFGIEPIEIPWRYVHAIDLGAGGKDAFEASRTAMRGNKDHVFAAVGKGAEARLRRVSLRVTGIDSKGLRTRESARPVPLSRVRGIVFAPDRGVAPDPLPNPVATLELVNGRELRGRVVGWLPEVFRLRLAEGVTVSILARHVRKARIASDRLVLLGDIERVVEQTAAFDTVWPIADNAAPEGGPIMMRGRSFDRGIVAVPRTRLRYDVAGRFDVFEATIGLADGFGPQAHAVVRILADDKVVFENTELTGASAPKQLSVEIHKAKRLTIEVDFGDHFDLGDRVAIIAPRLLSR